MTNAVRLDELKAGDVFEDRKGMYIMIDSEPSDKAKVTYIYFYSRRDMNEEPHIDPFMYTIEKNAFSTVVTRICNMKDMGKLLLEKAEDSKKLEKKNAL